MGGYKDDRSLADLEAELAAMGLGVSPLRNAATAVADALVRKASVENASATAVAASSGVPGRTAAHPATRLEMSRHVTRSHEMSRQVTSSANRPNEANCRPAMSREVTASHEMSRQVTSDEKRPNKANLSAGVPLALRAGIGGGLSEAQLAAVRLLLEGQRLTQIAAALQIERRTLWRWRKSPVFIAELRRMHERRCGR